MLFGQNKQIVSVSAGTTRVSEVHVSEFHLDEENTLVVVNSPEMVADLSLKASPQRLTIGVGDEVEQSIKEHADVWQELAKY